MDKLKSFDIATSVTDSLIEVFDTMVSMKLELSEDESLSLSEDDRIVGSVSVAGKIKGIILFQVSDEFSRIITAAMQEVEVKEVKDLEEIKDVIRELCNIVGGNLKSLFCDAGMTCEVSPPSFTTGRDFKIESLNIVRHERYTFVHEQHPVIVEVAVRADETENDESLQADVKAIAVRDVRQFDLKIPLLESTIELFETMLSMEIHAAEEPSTDLLQGERIVGSVNMAGLITGNTSIIISKAFSYKMTASMLGLDVNEVAGGEDVKDVISELCNIIGGTLKSKLCDAGMFCTLSTPSYTIGSDFDILSQDMTSFERLEFVHENEKFYIEAGLKISDSAAAGRTREKVRAADNIPESVVSQDDIDALLKAEANNDVPASVVSQDDIDALLKADSDNAALQGDRDKPLNPEASQSAPQAEDVQGEIDGLLKTHTQSDVAPDVARSGDGPGSEKQSPWDGDNLDLVFDIPLELTVALGQTEKRLDEILKINKGSIIDLQCMEGEPVDLIVNNTLIARGEVVVEKERYGVRVTETVSCVKRIQSLA
jgi:flagellar motor switch protein FliN